MSGGSCDDGFFRDIEAGEDQTNLWGNMMQLNNKSGSRVKDGKTKKVILFKSVNTIYERRELTSNAFKSKIFAVKPLQEK